ncbi:TIGR03013 family PEP-CTERM/XrtA system glycosyltransferase [Colwellia sp. MB02u-18]|uniref:TIGR03013 family XrtA/PEP-CTERM system glycosyltransferase n=1 Tax=unclassified Colwellia TaxID=196834 RepID=UPI0015F70854|nr:MULTISPECIES: TIGR03013 family XrtA/PEP-CTERM system glycosyltransferase [unclassified Colwellia]MBA6225807.1 TIGR03013 family PEP-CTERM/XrtA system glycosyltransferase [Colwellia sp. MB3u-45]MBA6267043.1 TIGR03013 family PEP-CTERM/XrtA system glycosyltransferase [Colwellia sp. MB3u-43]MBA6295135.1 TIGR03013 family PEP-CTERM/XrtA system glycosyltransferase [Colwellia sp. MB02u-9]MBA6321967.1 TIGR03013 family PEP-CTERM/XrtA system glycosyltransferase [Colwellia sp. MB02u-19]MBA6325197.1 TIGR
MSSLKFRDLSSGSKSLVLIEFFCFAGALLLSLYLNSLFHFVAYDTQSIALNVLFIHAVVFALMVQLSCLAMGLYNSKLRENLRGVMRRLLVSVAIGFFIVSLLNPIYGADALAIELLAMASLISLFIVSAVRYLTLRIDFFGFNKRNILVLGGGERASIIERRMRRDVDRQNFFMHGFVVLNGDADHGIINENIIKLDTSLVNYALEHQIDEIVVANDERRENLPVDELFACKIRGVEITEILDFIERETGQIAVNLIYPSWVIYSNGFASPNHLRNTLDWVFNAGMGFILLMVTWPIMLITTLLIKLDEGLKAPVFYSQERVGVDGQAFSIIKFRSMRLDAEKNGAQMASENDDRTTRIGKFIRKYRIDELPQIYNVMLGEMGFVGPRPERPEFVQQLIKNIPYYNERHNVKPGLTGWAQLKYPYGATENDSLEKLKYDLYYIKHRSFMLDLLILIRTVEIILFGKGR